MTTQIERINKVAKMVGRVGKFLPEGNEYIEPLINCLQILEDLHDKAKNDLNSPGNDSFMFAELERNLLNAMDYTERSLTEAKKLFTELEE